MTIKEAPSSKKGYGFTKLELQSVGDLHNDFVLKAYQNVDFDNCKECRTEINAEFRKIAVDLPKSDLTVDEIMATANQLYDNIKTFDFDLRNWKDHDFSDASYRHLVSLMEKIDEIVNYESFIGEMESLQSLIDSDISLDQFDRELLTGTVEVAKNSVKLWLPIELGGLNLYSKSRKGKIDLRYSWRNAARADITASAGFWLTLGGAGALGLAVPGSNAAILGSWAFSAGFSSAIGGI